MKNIIKCSTKLLMTLFGIALMMVSCEYDTNFRPATYPNQIIYMPAANGGNFVINDIARRIGDPVVAGHPYRYLVDSVSRKFNIPLSVYRAGINNDGGFKVDIAVNSDTINKLIAAGKLLNTILLGSDKYSIISSVNMMDGEEIASFNLVVNLDSLRNNYPGKIFALGVGISSTQRTTNPKLGTTIVVIDTKIMKPSSNFTFTIDGTNSKKIIFKNSSLMATRYLWNFGDGSLISSTISPTYTFPSAGTYTVTLTAIGLTGIEDKSSMTSVITIL